MHVHKPHTARLTPQAGRSLTALVARAASRTRRRPAPSARPSAPVRAPSPRCCLAASSAAWASAPRSAACPSSFRRSRRHHSAASSARSTRCAPSPCLDCLDYLPARLRDCLLPSLLPCLPPSLPPCLPACLPACLSLTLSASPCLRLLQLFTCGGILLSIVAGLPLARAGPAYWRKMFAVAILPCIAQLGALLWVPESPRWLAKAGRKASNPNPNPNPDPNPDPSLHPSPNPNLNPNPNPTSPRRGARPRPRRRQPGCGARVRPCPRWRRARRWVAAGGSC